MIRLGGDPPRAKAAANRFRQAPRAARRGLPGRRRARRPGLADHSRAQVDAAGGRGAVRQPDFAGNSPCCRSATKRLCRQTAGGPRDRQEAINALLVERALGDSGCCGSKAATRSCSAAAARKSTRSPPTASGSKSFRHHGGAGRRRYAGIPLTHRDHAQSCVFVAGQQKDGRVDLDWTALAGRGRRSSSTWDS